jgi:uncharacterized protein (DUF4415 family)
MQKTNSARASELRVLRRMKDTEIDTTDIPQRLDWSQAVVGKFYRPIKKPLTIRLDADVLAWLKAQGSGYQTRINGLLRSAMENADSGTLVVRMSDYGEFTV